MIKIPTDFISFLHLGLLSTVYIFTIIYVVNNWKKSLFNKLISLYLVTLSYGLTGSSIVLNNLLVYVPHMARTTLLVVLIFNPILYFAIEKGIFNRKFRRKDLLHLIPALLYIANFLPFFLLSKAEKIIKIKSGKIAEFGEGWLFPNYFIPVFILAHIIFYTIIIYNQFLREGLSVLSNEIRLKMKFFWAYNLFHTLPVILTIYGFHEGDMRGSVNLIYIIGNLVFFFLLLNKPTIIYDADEKNTCDLSLTGIKTKVLSVPDFENDKEILKNKLIIRKKKETINEKEVNLLNPKQQVQLKRLEILMEKDKPFLKSSFSQSQITHSLSISNEGLRVLLKIQYGMTFSDYSNYSRIMYLTQQIEKEAIWRNYSIQTLSEELGYKTANSLYINCKKFTGLTPRELLESLTKEAKVFI